MYARVSSRVAKRDGYQAWTNRVTKRNASDAEQGLANHCCKSSTSDPLCVLLQVMSPILRRLSTLGGLHYLHDLYHLLVQHHLKGYIEWHRLQSLRTSKEGKGKGGDGGDISRNIVFR